MINDNYKTIEHQLRKYSFEFLKVSDEPVEMLEQLNDNYPEMITDALKPSYLSELDIVLNYL